MDGRLFDGAQFRAARQARGVRMIDLARAADCSYGHLRMAERGTVNPATGQRTYRQPSTELAYRLASALTALSGHEVTIDDFSTPIESDAAA